MHEEGIVGIIGFIDDVASYMTSDIKAQTGKGFIKTFTDVGNYGEFQSYKYLFMTPGKREFIHNCYLPTDNGSTEIDLLMIHETGLYVVESKNYSGWIFGSESQKQWTQVLAGGKKSQFFNPIWQNAGHIKALKNFFNEYQDLPIFSLIVFSERCELKKITFQTENVFVIKRNQLRHVFKKQIQGKNKCSSETMNDIYQRLLPLCKKTELEKQQHIDRINEIKYSQDSVSESVDLPVSVGIETHPINTEKPDVTEVQDQTTTKSLSETEKASNFGVCPRCGAKLIERNGKNGPFIGCSSFPKCRYTASL